MSSGFRPFAGNVVSTILLYPKTRLERIYTYRAATAGIKSFQLMTSSRKTILVFMERLEAVLVILLLSVRSEAE